MIFGLNYFIALATDNATVNNVIFQTAACDLLSLYNIPENPDHHICCLAHVINLVVQAMMASLDEADPCNNFSDDNDYFLLHKDTPIFMISLKMKPRTNLKRAEMPTWRWKRMRMMMKLMLHSLRSFMKKSRKRCRPLD
jgi:hypothetical protein